MLITGFSRAKAGWISVWIGSPRPMASSRPLIIWAPDGPTVSGDRSGPRGAILASVVGKVVMTNLRLKLASHEAFAQPAPKPHGGYVQHRDQENENQRRGEDHGLGRFAVLALKTHVVNVKPQVHKAALRVDGREDTVHG